MWGTYLGSKKGFPSPKPEKGKHAVIVRLTPVRVKSLFVKSLSAPSLAVQLIVYPPLSPHSSSPR